MVDLALIEQFHRRFHTIPQLEAGLVRGEAATPWGVLRQLAREVAARRDGIRQRLVQAEDAKLESEAAGKSQRPVRATVLAQTAVEQVRAAEDLAAEMLALAGVADALAQQFAGLTEAEMAELDDTEQAGRLLMRALSTLRLTGRPDAQALDRAWRLGHAGRGMAGLLSDPEALGTHVQGLLDRLESVPKTQAVERAQAVAALRQEATSIGFLLPPID
ncbi:hypothetical protein [Engelhardtia mirabilis]|uniref:Uncharacterized protein n=1 Tax=Engelhardtia mirabilis TaxID=2528011 RepID=A0A518BL73_9BACT|nr:hypothetical protein Pla133_28050 [Planctomycetes bacterium Pla133]QDV02043.1 hypothetical protein Pla86_28040 [Planctomycetes bacterium Pla86]